MATDPTTQKFVDQAMQDAEIARHCTEAEHVWPPEYDYGDTCNCGALYLLQDETGFIRVQFTKGMVDGD
jgi:hypothetical protein